MTKSESLRMRAVIVAADEETERVATLLERGGAEVLRLPEPSRLDASFLADLDLVVATREALGPEGKEGLRVDLGLDGDVPILLAGAGVDLVDEVRTRTRPGASSAEFYRELAEVAQAALDAATAGQPPDLIRTRLAAERVHSHLLRENGLVLRSLEPHEQFDMARHSANVGIIAGKIALGMAMGVEDVVRAITAGLVHDIGMARLPVDLVRKPGRLSEEERALMRTHPVLGAELLADVSSRFAWVEPVVLQEHERMHGQGYPAGLVGAAIDPLAQIVGLADVFEALSHPRSYRSPYTALEALEQVSEMKGEYFEAGVVSALVNEISAFPLDSYVQLSSGEIAQVVGTNPENILRPEVLVRWDSEWNLLSQPRRIDLMDAPELTVARSLIETELPIS